MRCPQCGKEMYEDTTKRDDMTERGEYVLALCTCGCRLLRSVGEGERQKMEEAAYRLGPEARRNPDRILREAIRCWGDSVQRLKVLEELGELTQAIVKTWLCDDCEEEAMLANLAEEMADVELMLQQLKIMYDNEDEVKEWRFKKLERLAGRIEREFGR